MKNIEEFISTCESLMIGEDEIVLEGIGGIIIGSHVAIAGLISVAFLINNITEKRNNKKLNNRSFTDVYRYVKDAKELKIPKNTITAMKEFTLIAPNIGKELKNIFNDGFELLSKYKDSVPDAKVAEYEKLVKNIDKNVKTFKTKIDKLISTESEIYTDLSYRKTVYDFTHFYFDIELGITDIDNLVDEATNKGLYNSEESMNQDDFYDKRIDKLFSSLMRTSQDLRNIADNITSKIKIRVK